MYLCCLWKYTGFYPKANIRLHHSFCFSASPEKHIHCIFACTVYMVMLFLWVNCSSWIKLRKLGWQVWLLLHLYSWSLSGSPFCLCFHRTGWFKAYQQLSVLFQEMCAVKARFGCWWCWSDCVLSFLILVRGCSFSAEKLTAVNECFAIAAALRKDRGMCVCACVCKMLTVDQFKGQDT